MSDFAPVDPTLPGLRARLPRLIEDLADLVAVESPAEDPRATATSADAVTALGSRLLGSAPERHGSHLVWSHGETRVLLIGHHDTVWPVGTLARWPFRVDGDRATGPGCFDMKAGLVQLFHALSIRSSLDGVTVVVNGDEEVGSPDSRVLIERVARGARAALICEPSADGALKTARKGIARYRLEIAGRAAHAGLDPGRGVNAAVELAHQILAVAGLGDGETTVTPTVLAGGSTENTVPAAAGVAVDVRAFDQAEFERVDRAMQGLRPVLAGSRLTVHGGVHRPALPPTASARLYELARTVAAELGLAAPAGVAVGGASDGNLTAGYGIPTLDGLGPVGGNAHAEGEWVDLPAMAERAALLAALVDRVLRPRA
ncbi:M20 family metallopeptidase [Catellatospora chokoriensis]|uniref:Glutamate carboxypeptidase n=1 Tax=Catellatospora chokoriensis TaxID=310353 RepID=A0A8J3K939_9ACTN|nr:M20 family metallopeptidase [Catellatospora chokoriensis]GIF90789.1 glutamate carboxypeptidase [Catellatospora chokoriensis]